MVFNQVKETLHFIFGDDPFNQQFSTPVNRNIYRNGNYPSVGKNKFKYTITAQDFKNALPCEDNGCGF